MAGPGLPLLGSHRVGLVLVQLVLVLLLCPINRGTHCSGSFYFSLRNFKLPVCSCPSAVMKASTRQKSPPPYTTSRGLLPREVLAEVFIQCLLDTRRWPVFEIRKSSVRPKKNTSFVCLRETMQRLRVLLVATTVLEIYKYITKGMD